MEKWIADAVGKMHVYKIKQSDLAKKLDYTTEYVNMVLNGKRTPAGAETTFVAALNELIAERS